MAESFIPNPAQIAAEKALSALRECLDGRKSFRFEAGAGAGKTYSLIECLKHLLDVHGRQLRRNAQRVACITYTNVASDEIASRMGGHPSLWSSTIHAFCWSMINAFQPRLRSELSSIDRWQERLQAAGGVGGRAVEYDLGYPTLAADGNVALLGHDDVLTIFSRLLQEEKFRRLLASRFPFIFVDEYQDTNRELAQAIVSDLLGNNSGVVLGFFGDHWQKIYQKTVGLIEHQILVPIQKEANFRSSQSVVKVLNRMRPSLPQAVSDPGRLGSAVVYHSNHWVGTRKKGSHWAGDLPDEVSHDALQRLISDLKNEGWDSIDGKLKILMLTHNVLAHEQGYERIAEVFDGRTELYVEKQDPHIEFLVEMVEPVSRFFSDGKYGRMFEALGSFTPKIETVSQKKSWKSDIDRLNVLRSNATIGEVIDFLKVAGHPKVPEKVARAEQKLEKWASGNDPEPSNSTIRLKELRSLPYKQLTALASFIDERTPFATKHGVKGEEYENVIVVIGRGWNLYNFSNFLEWSGPLGIPPGKEDSYERNRNLFYVACSRAKTRLAVLFTQELSDGAMRTLRDWFLPENVRPAMLPEGPG